MRLEWVGQSRFPIGSDRVSLQTRDDLRRGVEVLGILRGGLLLVQQE